MKHEPMGIDEIKVHVELHAPCIGTPCVWVRLILAYVEQLARAEQYLFNLVHPTVCRACTDHRKITWREADWLNAILDEIGWPKEQR